jgi:DNA-directed RNA polymerase subunit RPC12/RpoP
MCRKPTRPRQTLVPATEALFAFSMEGPAVEEDVLGTQRVLNHTVYVTCSRCGQAVPRATASIVEGDALEDGSEYTYLCADCQRALADGEQDLPTTLI